MRVKSVFRGVLAAAWVLAAWVGTAAASATTPQLTSDDLEAWLDGLVPFALQRGDLAGAAVVVVRDGEILFGKGYGYADVAARTPVDPQRTLFRMASISKTFTWTAVMQQVEQGRLDLDRDVNDYLDFKIRPAFGKPITLRQLFTHSAGFEETMRASVVYDPVVPLPPIGDYLKANQPARIFPPGAVPAYSNYGTTLAAYLVERVSGEPFLDYMDKHVLLPLGMRQSSFRQPLPKALRGQLSKGYLTASQPPQPFEGVVVAPAGSLSATPMDMARFMIAHLQEGELGDARILQPETARLMHAPQFRAIEPLNGMSLGFFQEDRNGRRIIGHSGDTGLFHSHMRLYLDDGVGLFLTINTSGPNLSADLLRRTLLDQFTDRYFPADLPPEPTAATAVEHARLLEGRYAASRGFVTSFMAAPGLFEQIQVRANLDGTLSIANFAFNGLNERPRIWREIAPFVWREQAGKERLAAKVLEGQVIGLSTDRFSGIMQWRPVAAWQSAAWNVPLLLASVALLLVALIAWPVTSWRRRAAVAGPEHLAGRLTHWAVLANLVFLTGWAVFIVGAGSNRDLVSGTFDPVLRLLQLLGLIAALGTGATICQAWRTWRQADVHWSAKAWSAVLAMACVAVTWFSFAFKLITPGLRY